MIDLAQLHRRLIVSCQAPDGSPLRDPGIIAAIAEAAVIAGAAAVRINSAAHVAAVRQRVTVPIIGLQKVVDQRGTQWITPTLDDAQALRDAGADIIAIDATLRERSGTPVNLLLPAVRDLGVLVMADIDDLESGERAARLGAELVGTTLSGYTTAQQNRLGGPDIELVRALSIGSAFVVAEGRIKSPAEVADAFDAGAFAVVVGTSITDPMALTRRFLAGTHTLTKGASS
jgi:N-acylglucosamine-6-phosphate 2-epimerase